MRLERSWKHFLDGSSSEAGEEEEEEEGVPDIDQRLDSIRAFRLGIFETPAEINLWQMY